MTIDKEMLVEKIKNNWWIILVIGLSILLLYSGYKNFTHYDEVDKLKKEQVIQKIDEEIAKNQEILKQIKTSIDSIHIEQKYTIQKIDGTLTSINKLDKKRNEKVKYIYNSSPDSTISFLSNRYSKLSKDSLSR